MIVVKGVGVQIDAEFLTFKQKVIAFVKFHSTQVLFIWGVIYGTWQVIPDDVKLDLFGVMPPIAHKALSLLFVMSLAVGVYKAKMSTQTVEVPPPKNDAFPPPVVNPPVDKE